MKKIYTLPEETLIYPGHDYHERFVTTVIQEKKRNPRIGSERSLEEFIVIMQNLDLPYLKFIDFAVPGNRKCGVCPEKLPEMLNEYCQQMTLSPQG